MDITQTLNDIIHRFYTNYAFTYQDTNNMCNIVTCLSYIHFNQILILLNCCILRPAGTVLLFCRNRFIDVYCHMFIAAREFMLHRS